jgi:LmbE family N-acetylglucosaminyl deacetylase
MLCVTLSDNQKNPLLSDLVAEHHRSMGVLGVQPEKALIEGFETRNFPRDRQEILEYLYGLNQDYSPDIVFAHCGSDIHQDHAVVTQEALRAFRGTTVLGFDVLRSSYGFFPQFLVEVDAEDVDKKVAALNEYKSYADRYYFDPEVIRATLIRHGALAERPFAEGFEILRIVGSFEEIESSR